MARAQGQKAWVSLTLGLIMAAIEVTGAGFVAPPDVFAAAQNQIVPPLSLVESEALRVTIRERMKQADRIKEITIIPSMHGLRAEAADVLDLLFKEDEETSHIQATMGRDEGQIKEWKRDGTSHTYDVVFKPGQKFEDPLFVRRDGVDFSRLPDRNVAAADYKILTHYMNSYFYSEIERMAVLFRAAPKEGSVLYHAYGRFDTNALPVSAPLKDGMMMKVAAYAAVGPYPFGPSGSPGLFMDVALMQNDKTGRSWLDIQAVWDRENGTSYPCHFTANGAKDTPERLMAALTRTIKQKPFVKGLSVAEERFITDQVPLLFTSMQKDLAWFFKRRGLPATTDNLIVPVQGTPFKEEYKRPVTIR